MRNIIQHDCACTSQPIFTFVPAEIICPTCKKVLKQKRISEKDYELYIRKQKSKGGK